MNPENNWRIGFVLVTFSAVFMGYCFHGQQISDIVRYFNNCLSFLILLLQFEKLHSLFSACRWENWNTKNRKFLLILLPNTSRKYEVTLAGLMVINYPLLLSVSLLFLQFWLVNNYYNSFQAVKLSYSLLTLTLNLKK